MSVRGLVTQLVEDFFFLTFYERGCWSPDAQIVGKKCANSLFSTFSSLLQCFVDFFFVVIISVVHNVALSCQAGRNRQASFGSHCCRLIDRHLCLLCVIIEMHLLVSSPCFRWQLFGLDLHQHRPTSPPQPGFKIHFLRTARSPCSSQCPDCPSATLLTNWRLRNSELHKQQACRSVCHDYPSPTNPTGWGLTTFVVTV